MNSVNMGPILSNQSWAVTASVNPLGFIPTSTSIRGTADFDQLKVNNRDIIEWLNLISGLVGLPTRDIEMEQKYPQLTTLWFASVNAAIENSKHMVSDASLQYTKKLDELITFETLKK